MCSWWTHSKYCILLPNFPIFFIIQTHLSLQSALWSWYSSSSTRSADEFDTVSQRFLAESHMLSPVAPILRNWVTTTEASGAPDSGRLTSGPLFCSLRGGVWREAQVPTCGLVDINMASLANWNARPPRRLHGGSPLTDSQRTWKSGCCQI